MTTLKNIRSMIARGIAKDLEELDEAQAYELAAKHLDKVDTSAGTYGITGAVLLDRETGQLWAAAGRSSRLFMFV